MDFSILDLIRVVMAFGQLLIAISLVYVYLCLRRYCIVHNANGLVLLYQRIILAAGHYVLWSVVIAVIGLFVTSFVFSIIASFWRLATVAHVLIVSANAIVTFLQYEEASNGHQSPDSEPNQGY